MTFGPNKQPQSGTGHLRAKRAGRTIGSAFARSAQNALEGADAGSAPPHGAMARRDIWLSELRPGECGHILRVGGTSQRRLRLLEMGLTPGTHVKLVRAAAFGGPLDIEVRGYQLSLRREEASFVWLGEAEEAA